MIFNDIFRNLWLILVEAIATFIILKWMLIDRGYEPFSTLVLTAGALFGSCYSFLTSNEETDITVKKDNDGGISPNFMYKYLPGEISLSKVLEDLGQPRLKEPFEIEDDAEVLTLYKYKFSNACVWFTFNKDEVLVSVSLISLSETNPIDCPSAPADEGGYLGKALISQNIIDYKEKFEKQLYAQWSYSAITSRYIDYKYEKRFYYTYWNYNYFKKKKEMLDKVIEGVCISSRSDVHPIIHFDEFFYN